MRWLAAVPLVLAACEKPAPDDPKWRDGLESFRKQRARVIDEAWLTVVGRFPLRPGPNTIGSDAKSAAVLPADRAPPFAGTLIVEDGTLYFQAAEGVDVKVKGQSVTTTPVADDSKGPPTVLELGSLRLHVIQRGGHFMLRAKDLKAPARDGFKGLSWYDPAQKWRLKGHFEPSPPGTTIPIVNVLNMTEQQPSPGHVSFTVGDKPYRLVALQEGDELFLVFKDETAGHGTYPSGRFLNTPLPAPDGTVDLDFNRAYTPPCGFTKFATCPLPPRENHLPLEIAAGETYSGSH